MGFFDKVDMTKKEKTPAIDQLAKRGDSHTIDLTKKTGEFLVNLNWNSSIETKGMFGFLSKSTLDLDLGCMYRLKDGSQGVIQALGNLFGRYPLTLILVWIKMTVQVKVVMARILG